jgi:hypothetical protein
MECVGPAPFTIAHGLSWVDVFCSRCRSMGVRGRPDEPLTNGGRGPSHRREVSGAIPSALPCPTVVRRGATYAGTAVDDARPAPAVHHGSPRGGRRGGAAPPSRRSAGPARASHFTRGSRMRTPRFATDLQSTAIPGLTCFFVAILRLRPCIVREDGQHQLGNPAWSPPYWA